MLLDEKINDLQKLTKKKITYDEVAKVLGLGSKQAAQNRVTRRQKLKEWEILALDAAFLKTNSSADILNSPITKDEILKELEEIKEHLKNTTKPVSGTINLTYRPDVSLSAGYGIEVYNEAAQTFAIDSRLLTTERGNKINPKYCEIVAVAGNSMYPEYREGDRVIINKADTTLTDGQIYAIRYRGQCFVKEINLLPDKIKCISLNKEYDPFYINENEDFVVIGRIIPRIRL